jgi:hypothetical protein
MKRPTEILFAGGGRSPASVRTAGQRAGRLLSVGVLVCSIALSGACRPFDPPGQSVPLPPRDETIAFFSEADQRVDRERFRPIAFAPGRHELTQSDESTVRGIVAALGPEERLVLAGVGADQSSPEWNRVLGERRAIEVRDALRRAGLDPSRVHTASSGSDVIGNGGGGRVEIGVIKR